MSPGPPFATKFLVPGLLPPLNPDPRNWVGKATRMAGVPGGCCRKADSLWSPGLARGELCASDR
jgi:hypothetical protein